MNENEVFLMNKINDLERRVDNVQVSSINSDNTLTFKCDTLTSNLSTTSSELTATKYLVEAQEKQNDVTQKLLKELIAEIKDLKDEGAQQEREIEQIRDEFEKFKEEVRELLKENTESNMGAIATGLWSSWKSGSNGYLGYSSVDNSIKVDPIGDADIGGSSVSIKKLKMERQVTGDSNGHTVVVDTYTDDESGDA